MNDTNYLYIAFILAIYAAIHFDKNLRPLTPKDSDVLDRWDNQR